MTLRFAPLSAWSRTAHAGFAFLPLFALMLGADAPTAKPAAKAKAKLVADQTKVNPTEVAKPDAEKGKKALAALKELKAAVDKPESGNSASSTAALASRPKKSITPPTMTAATIDDMLNKSLKDSKAVVSPQTSDEEFVRRIYLDVTGRVPSIDEMRAFLHSRDKDKRAKLIDSLLKSHAFATNQARYWRDVISYRAPNETPQQINYPSFESWLSDEFAKNKPWDEVVHEILTAKGANTENGATAFSLAQMGQPVELAGEVSRVFMGIQIQCAQCHDHPSDKWKREQFHEFAAFFAGVRQAQIVKRDPANKQPAVFGIIAVKGAQRYTMPDKKDPTVQIPMNPKFFVGEHSPSHVGLKTDDRRELLASYVTGQDNPWFAKAFVNRVWGSLMGEGFYNPVDDMGPTKESHNTEVLDAIASQWQKGGYDVAWLYRTILNTHAYQRESRSTNSAAGRTRFAANCPSRLRADQIFDSLAQALGLPVETFARPNANAARMAMAKKLEKGKEKAGEKDKDVSVAQAAAMQTNRAQNGPRGKFNKTFGVDPSTPNDDVMGTIPQALYLMNSQAVNNNLRATPNSMLGELLKSTADNRVVLETLYVRVLARRPSAKEIQVCGHYLEQVGNRVEGFEDILWSLLNSTEFISRR